MTDTQPPAAPETDVSARQWLIEAEDGTRAFTSEDVALRVATGDHGYTLGIDRDPIVASFTRANPGDEWTPITTGSLLADLEAARDRVRVVEGERDRNKRACETLGHVVEQQCRAALDATGLHDWIDEDGDGDWGAIWDNLAGLRPRAESAEAAHAALRKGIEALADAAEFRANSSLSRTFDGSTFGAWVSAESLRALLAGGAR